MAEALQPGFPALHVESDGSLEVLSSNADWTDDVDHWYWSSPDSYLIDLQLRRFNPIAKRSPDGRPRDIPEWRLSDTLEIEVIERLIRNNPNGEDSDPDLSYFLQAVAKTTRAQQGSDGKPDTVAS